MIPGVKIIDDFLKGLPDNARLRSEIAKLATEIEQRDVTIQKLQAELQEARVKIERLKPENQDMDADTLKVLHLFFTAGTELSKGHVAAQLGFQISVAEFHFDELVRRAFIEQSGVGYDIPSCRYALLPEGRRYVMAHRT
ncbi:MAG: hypothetical protein ABSC03_06340 [Verrucomicrobiota bacterium]|jgi:cell division septum initiation protein DivIVA